MSLMDELQDHIHNWMNSHGKEPPCINVTLSEYKIIEKELLSNANTLYMPLQGGAKLLSFDGVHINIAQESDLGESIDEEQEQVWYAQEYDQE